MSVLVARGQFVTENISFSHLISAVQWLVCTNKYQARTTCTHPPHSHPPLSYRHWICSLSLSLSLTILSAHYPAQDIKHLRLVKEPQIHSLASAPFLFRACVSIRLHHHIVFCHSSAPTGRLDSCQPWPAGSVPLWFRYGSDWSVMAGSCGICWQLPTIPTTYQYFILWKGRKTLFQKDSRLASGWLVLSHSYRGQTKYLKPLSIQYHILQGI